MKGKDCHKNRSEESAKGWEVFFHNLVSFNQLGVHYLILLLKTQGVNATQTQGLVTQRNWVMP
jgi:hypothetical protein